MRYSDMKRITMPLRARTSALAAFVFVSAATGAQAASLSSPASPAEQAPGEWMHYPAFQSTVTRVVDTPRYAYFMGAPYNYQSSLKTFNDPACSLFRLDKTSGEVDPWLHPGNPGALVLNMVYDWHKGCLIVAYNSLDFDLVYDDGRIVNVANLIDINLPAVTVTINDITVDHNSGKAYVALNTGFAVIDLESGRMTDYRTLESPVSSVAVVGNLLAVISDSKMYYAPLSETPASLADFSVTNVNQGAGPRKLFPLSDTLCAYMRYSSGAYKMFLMEVKDDQLVWKEGLFGYENKTPVEIPDGYWCTSDTQEILLRRDGSYTRIAREEADHGAVGASLDGHTVVFAAPRKGVWTRSVDEAGNWSDVMDVCRPDAPSVYQSRFMEWSPVYGLVGISRGVDQIFPTGSNTDYFEISTFRGGAWKSFSLADTNPEQVTAFNRAEGIAVDPDDPAKIYVGSYTRGLIRVNLSDPTDILHISSPNDKGKNLPGFVVGRDTQKAWDICRFAAPSFDNEGWLWSVDWDMDLPASEAVRIWMWSPEDRRASVDAENFRPWKSIILPYKCSNYCSILPLRSPLNKNLVAVVPNTYDSYPFIVLDHAGTPDDPSDDRMVRLQQLYDADGTMIHSPIYVYSMCEDLQTGLLWVGSERGLYVVNPRQSFRDPNLGKIIRSTRPDGQEIILGHTSRVSHIFADSRNEKWVSLFGEGLVHTSPDGSKILGFYTANNSGLPTDEVCGVWEDKATGSYIVSTTAGLSRLILPSVDNLRPDGQATVSPASVTPDYKGWVTLTGILGTSDIRVVAPSGKTVRTLRAAGDTVQWDTADEAGVPVGSDEYTFECDGRTIGSVLVIR